MIDTDVLNLLYTEFYPCKVNQKQIKKCKMIDM